MRSKFMPGSVTVAGLLLIAAAVAIPAAAQQPCPPLCGLDVELPENIAEPPRIKPGQETIKASRSAVMLATLTYHGSADKAATKLVFRNPDTGQPDEAYTPFVDRAGPNGRPITEVRLRANGATTLFIRSDEAHKCFEAPGCKYDIVNDGASARPPLDPWIIIDR